MGLDMAEEEILQLLEIYNGNVEAVISHIYDNNWLEWLFIAFSYT